MGRRVLKFDGPSGRGLRIALRAMLIKSALRDWLSMSYGMKSILRIGSLRSPPPIRLRRTSPASGGKVVAPATKGGMPEWYMKYMTLCFSPQISCFPLRWQGNWIHRGEKRPANPVTRFPPGKVVAPATKEGLHFPRPPGRLYGFRRQRRYKKWRPQGRRTSPAQRYFITTLGGALNLPVRRSRSQAEPWQPRAERPGGWLNPHARKGVSTFGNTGKHRSQSRSRSRPRREAPEPSSPKGACP